MTTALRIGVPPTLRCSSIWIRSAASAAALLLGVLSSQSIQAQGAPREPLATGAATAPAAAEQEKAWTWISEGDQFFDEKDYARALERYAAAYRLVRAPTEGMAVARAQAALNQWLEASATALEVVNLPRHASESGVVERARAEALALWSDLRARIPVLKLQVTPTAAVVHVQIDGVAVAANAQLSFPLNPGSHRLSVAAAGYRAQDHELQLDEHEHQRLSIALVPDAPGAHAGSAAASPGTDTGSGARTRGYVALGVAGVAGLVGTTTGVLAITSKPSCPSDTCAPDQKDDAEASERFGNIATVSFGVAILAGGYALWELLANVPDESSVARSTPQPAARTTLSIVPSRGLLQVSGSF